MTSQLELWRDTIVKINTPIKDAIERLNKVGLKIALVLDDNYRLLGTVSDGDFRRGILGGLSLEDRVEKIMNKNPHTVSASAGRLEILKVMTDTKILQIPIIDENNFVIGLHLWNDISFQARYSNIMVIMAGGKGSRLHPQTKNRPKPMLLVAGVPILEHIIKRAHSQGFTHFIIAINYLGEIIEKYFKDGQKFGVKIEYLREDVPLGTGGALSLLNSKPEKSFIVTNGDVMADINYADFLEYHTAQNAAATVAVHTHEFQIPYGVVQINGLEVDSYEEKPIVSSLINAGVYALEPDVLDFIKEPRYRDMPEILDISRHLKKKVVVYPLYESWIDIGRPIDLETANKNKFRKA